MKHLIISLFLTGSLFSTFAQTDSTSPNMIVVRDSTPITNNSTSNMNSTTNDSTGSINNSIRSDSTGSMNNSMRDSAAIMKNGMAGDSTGSMIKSMRSDSAGIMKNGMAGDSTGSMNNNSNSNLNSSNTNNPANINNPGTNGIQTNSSNMGTSVQRSQASANGVMPVTSSGTMVNSQNIAGKVGYASLPVLETYVPADIVSKVKSKYNLVYDITAIKDTADKTAYVVRYGDNGVYKTEIMGEDGSAVQ